MDYEAWRFWVDLSQFVLTGALGIYLWLVNRTRVNAERIRQLEDDIDNRVDAIDQRVTRLEATGEHAPTHDDLGKIHNRIDECTKGVSSLEGKFQKANETLNTIHEFLLNRRQP